MFWRRKQHVRFYINLQEGICAKEIKKDLESLAKDLTIYVTDLTPLLKAELVVGETNQKTYEQLFNAKLEYQTKTIPNLNRGPYKVKEWVEIESAQVPENLKQIIESIKLEKPTYFTD